MGTPTHQTSPSRLDSIDPTFFFVNCGFFKIVIDESHQLLSVYHHPDE